mgnify:CR=1 FL=1
MRILIQRVSRATLSIDGREYSHIDGGLLVFAGVEAADGDDDIAWLAGKLLRLRIFDDADGVMNLDVTQAGGQIMIVSQFTLYGDVSHGRRPSFIGAARPETAIPLYERVIALCREAGFHVETGEFGADMLVESVNNGPITILLDTKEL